MIQEGLLARHFKSVAAKRLTSVETNPGASNQHELNGVSELKKIFGSEKTTLPARFLWLGTEEEAVSETGFVTWYDAREAHPTRSEFRLFYSTTSVMPGLAKEGDTLFVCLRTDNSALLIVVPPGSSVSSQLAWLFGLSDQPSIRFETRQVSAGSDEPKLEFATRYILDELGLETKRSDEEQFDAQLKQFEDVFPPTKVFSSLARATLPEVSALDNPDEVILEWMAREELLFRRLERKIIGKRLKTGFAPNGTPDVDEFMNFSLSVQNRRKARAGAALENHLAYLFETRRLAVGQNCITENKNRPDFLFPGCAAYHSPNFPHNMLTMLAAKSSLKDRWRQVLSEAKRIETKHLITLSPSVSIAQTEEMKSHSLQLVVPGKLHQTFAPTQQSWLMSLSQFIELVETRQKARPQ